MGDTQLILDVVLATMDQSFDGLSQENKTFLLSTLTSQLSNQITAEEAQERLTPIFLGHCNAVDKIAKIVITSNEPIPRAETNDSSHKTRPWNPYEDQRLLAGILRFGLEDWLQISEFVGNGRNRSQCSQRWNRGLNPRLSKCSWSQAEDAKLRHLASVYGDRSWTKISAEMGNRSDIQCRYRYSQLLKEEESKNSAIPDKNRNNLDKLFSGNSIPQQQSMNSMMVPNIGLTPPQLPVQNIQKIPQMGINVNMPNMMGMNQGMYMPMNQPPMKIPSKMAQNQYQNSQPEKSNSSDALLNLRETNYPQLSILPIDPMIFRERRHHLYRRS